MTRADDVSLIICHSVWVIVVPIKISKYPVVVQSGVGWSAYLQNSRARISPTGGTGSRSWNRSSPG